MNKITTAIIPVAGWGTRQLPITKAIEKAMLPVAGRPLVDYAVQDCISAGITEIIFVVGEQSEQIHNYYTHNTALEEYLNRTGKTDYIELVQPPKNVNFHFVVQPAEGKYGTAIPVAMAAEEFGLTETGAVVLMGDDFIYHPNGESEVARLLEAAGDDSSLLGVEIDPQEVSHYGVLRLSDKDHLEGITEKPNTEDAPSNLINVSKYVMSGDLLKAVCIFAKREDVAGEWHITTPLTDYAHAGGSISVLPASGQYLDGGTLAGWLHANKVVIATEDLL